MYGDLVKQLRDSAEWADRLAVLMGRAEGDAHAPIMRKAAEAIEELQGRAKVLEKVADKWCKAVPKWIPVTERLPKESERVLVACEDGVSFGFFEGIIADDEFVKEWHDMMYYPISVSHWTPLPEPPKEE